MTRTRFEFVGLELVGDDRLLTPREWTRAQSVWAAELLPQLPSGAVLELCAGAGHIGLAAVHGSGRALVAVDREPVAAATIVDNASRLGMTDRVDVRCADLSDALERDESFAMVIADPPWVPTAEVGDFPRDPRGAIDGGDDGLTPARECVRLIADHLAPDGVALLQLGTRRQVSALDLPAHLHVDEVREYPRGVIAKLASPGR